MKRKAACLVIWVVVAFNAMAQNFNLHEKVPFGEESIKQLESAFSSEPDKKSSVSVYGFFRMPYMLDYNIHQEAIYFTPLFMSGLGLRHKNTIVEFSPFVDKNDNYGFSLDCMYLLKTKELDEQWMYSMGILGEIAYFPEQNANLELWIYTLGWAGQVYLPMKWGVPSFGFLLGGAFLNDEIHLNARMMINLSVPIL